MWILVWMTKKHNEYWDAYDNESEARAAYAKRLGMASTYSVSLCVPILSTDYSNPMEA